MGTSTGDIKVLYDPEKTNTQIGILKCVNKQVKRKQDKFAMFQENMIIINPLELYDQ